MGLVRLRPATPAETRWTKIIVIGLALYISCMYLTNYILTKRIVSGKGLEKTLVRMSNEALRHYGRKEVVGDVYDYTCKAVHQPVCRTGVPQSSVLSGISRLIAEQI